MRDEDESPIARWSVPRSTLWTVQPLNLTRK